MIYLQRVFLALALCLSSFLFSSEKRLADLDLKGSFSAGYLHIPRDRAIDQSTYLYVKYALESFREKNVRFVLLDLNTPGGEVFAALRVAEELQKMDREYHIPVIALIDNWALSAGALLAYSCRYIGAVKDASMGAAEPVIVSSDGKMETASEKMVSALRVEFAKAAESFGRNPLIAEAMVDKDVAVVLRKGKIVKLLDNSEIVTKGSGQDLVINPKGKLLTLNAKQLFEFKIAEFLLPSFVGGESISGAQKLFADPLFKEAEIHWISYSNWKIGFFAFLSHPFVSSLLMMGLMIGIYGEIQHPGFGFSALLALGCLGLILLSSFATELIGSLELIFLSIGLLLFLIEVFFLGGFGFLGGIGLLFFISGLIAVSLPPLQEFSWQIDSWGILMQEWIYRLSLFLSVFLVFFFLVIPIGSFFFRKTRSFQRLVLKEPEEVFKKELLDVDDGEEGMTVSSLRPLGKVEVRGMSYEAETEGEFVSSHTKVEVVRKEGRKLIVREKL
jgi:membrane-bound ClpP family serine protease